MAVEIKHGRNVSAADTRGLQSFARQRGKSKKPLHLWVLYRGERRQRFESGVEVWPVLSGLRALCGEDPL